MTLFDSTEDHGIRSSRRAESVYDYLSGSSRPPMQATRALLESWFAAYPPPHQAALKRRIQDDFDAGYLELFVFSLLRSLGLDPEIEPDLHTGASARPDFLVGPSNAPTVVEATVSSGESEAEAGLRRVRDDLTDRIDQLDLEAWLLDVTFVAVSPQQESIGKIAQFLRTSLDELDPDLLLHQVQKDGWESLPVFVYESDKVTIRFRPIPILPENRGKEGGRIALFAPRNEPVRVETPREVYRAVERKRPSRYGDFDSPYVVAVNVLAEFNPRFSDVVAALFGEVGLEVTPRDPVGSESEWTRMPNGVWFGPLGPRNTRMSAVLATVGLKPWALGKTNVYLFHHPVPEQSYVGALGRLTNVRLEEGQLMTYPGESLLDVFVLPDDWPGPEDPIPSSDCDST